jgi:phage terminase large subunit-like protein
MSLMQNSLNTSQKTELLALLEEKARRVATNKWKTYYPDEGLCNRFAYKKHMAFFAAGANYQQRLMMAANRVGKTELGAYEVMLHLTGLYPDWWVGKRFDRHTKGWAAGDTRQTVRDILVEKLLGPKSARGTGMIPLDYIVRIVPQPGVPDGVEIVEVRHVSGGVSKLGFKSFDQGRKSFQGTELDFVWLDEESPQEIYDECLIRLVTTKGLMLLTFTPLSGLSAVVMMFLPGGDIKEQTDEVASRFVVMATWDDVPHIDEQQKAIILASCMPHQLVARSKGVPSLGAGAIYPIPEEEITVDDFQIPDHWPRAYGIDVGWKKTAVVWGAIDPSSRTVYLYSEHYRGEAEPVVHTKSIHDRGDWIPGTIDPASRGRGQKDGEQLMQMYTDLGLDLVGADNGVDTGLFTTWTLLSAGQLKVFRSMKNWFEEYRIYQRDEKGHIMKRKDHLMDATRYFVMTGREIAITKPVPMQYQHQRYGDTQIGY